MMICHAIALSLLRLKRTSGTWLCQALALAAIIAPLLIVLGLKCGIVESMKEQLLKDPATLEVSMTGAVDVTPELLEKVKSWPETAFVIPSVGHLYSVVTLHTKDEQERVEAQMIPTAEGDPLLCNTGCSIPREGEAVLTERLAQRLGVQTGEIVHMRAWRNARREYKETDLRVVGILPEHHRSGMALLVPLELTVQAENFIISGTGEPGSAADVSDVEYDGVALGSGATTGLTDELCKTDSSLRLCANDEAGSLAGAAKGGYVLRGTGMNRHKVISLIRIAEESGTAAWPWVEPLMAELVCGNERMTMRLVGEEHPDVSFASLTAPPVIYVAMGVLSDSHAEIQVQAPERTSRIVCRVQHVEDVPTGEVRMLPSLLALVHKGKNIALEWDYRTGGVRYPVMRFISMRVFSRSLEQTESLYRRLTTEGVPCQAQLDIIRQVLSLDKSLTRLFLVLTGGAALGAVVSFALSLFNAAELHRRDYALVQLMGMGRFSLAVIPLVDALVTSFVALGMAFACYAGVGTIIGLMFSETVGGSGLCRLHPEHVVLFCGSIILLAFFASLAASVKVLLISPSEIIHES